MIALVRVLEVDLGRRSAPEGLRPSTPPRVRLVGRCGTALRAGGAPPLYPAAREASRKMWDGASEVRRLSVVGGWAVSAFVSWACLRLRRLGMFRPSAVTHVCRRRIGLRE